jgi:hypothetical protein
MVHRLIVLLLLTLAACASPAQQQIAMNLRPGFCSVNEVRTSWLANNVYALCEDGQGHVFAPPPGNATSPGQTAVSALGALAVAGAIGSVAAEIPSVPTTFKLATH